MNKILHNIFYMAKMAGVPRREEKIAYLNGAFEMYSELLKAGCPVKEYVSFEELAKFVDKIKEDKDKEIEDLHKTPFCTKSGKNRD